ncbi:MAG: hypothetical protein ACYTKD_14210 [Planctomycetota bacterium]|jgi:hypothetical protein
MKKPGKKSARKKSAKKKAARASGKRAKTASKRPAKAKPAAKSKKKAKASRPKRAPRERAALPARRPPGGASAPALPVSGDLFPPEEIERLRLTVLTSARREDKVEALRRLAYSPLEPDGKAELFLGRLADADAEVRVEAAQLLRTLGLDPEVADAVRDLERGDEAQKLFAIDRLGRRMAMGGPLEVGASLIALILRLREESSVPVRRQILERLEEVHEVIAGAPERAAELVRLLIALFASHPIDIGPPARRLVRRLGGRVPELVRSTLWHEYEGTSSHSLRVFILQLLSGLPEFEGDATLPGALAAEIARSEEHEIGFRLLGDTLMQLEDTGVRGALEAFPSAKPGQQRYLVRLIADACRFRDIPAATKEDVASLFLGLLAGHQREIQMMVLSTQLPTDRELSEETRRRLADGFLTHVNVFAFPADVDNVEHTVARAGLAAAGALLDRLGRGSPDAERVRAARILGELALVEGDSRDPGTRKALEDILRRLQEASLEPDFPDRATALTAMGKVTSTRAVPAETVEFVARNLLERGLKGADPAGTEAAGGEGAERRPFDHRVLEALGYLAASPHMKASRADEIEEIFRRQLDVDLPEISAEESEEDGVQVFSIGNEAEVYTEAVPASVKGLAHLAVGRPHDTERCVEVVDFLLARWERYLAGELDWGPPGSGALVESLRDISCGPKVDVAQKVRIVRAIARRLGQIPVVEALGRVFASEDRSVGLGRVAAAAGVALLRRRDDSSQFNEDEREFILHTLAVIAGRGTLEVGTDLTRHLRENIAEELFNGLRDGVQGCYEAVSRLRANEKLSVAFRESVSQRLSAYESLVLA